MKTFLITVSALLISLASIAQNGINYKALIKDANGDVIANQVITIQFQILENGTTNVYQETQNPTTDANGIIMVNIGEGTVDSGNFLMINWGANDHFLNVQIDTGDGLIDLGTTQFMSVPFALFAENTRKGTLNDAYNKGGNGEGRIIDATDGKVEINGEGLEVATEVGIGDKVYHVGDLDTSMEFSNNNINLKAGGFSGLLMDVNDQEIVVNNGGVNADFRVKSSGNDATVFVDGQNNRVGIGTDSPKGALDISGASNMGAIMPRVSDLNAVTDGNGNPPVDGTMVFDTSKNKLCVFINGDWACFGFQADGTIGGTNENQSTFLGATATQLTDSNQINNGVLGWDTELSEDGNVLAVSKPRIYNTTPGSVIIFEKLNGTWQETAELESNGIQFLYYGTDLDLNETGDKLIVGGLRYVYYYENVNGNWIEKEIIEVVNGVQEDFGRAVSLSDNGATMAVSGTDRNTSKGVIYIFDYNGSNWVETVQLEPETSNVDNAVFFGWNIALSGDGNTLVTGMPSETSTSIGINNYQSGSAATGAGAAYVYKLIAGAWNFSAYIKPHNTNANMRFGSGLSISGNGNRIAIGANCERTLAEGIYHSEFPDNIEQSSSGAVYIFDFDNNIWKQTAFIKSDSNDANDYFGLSVALSDDGNILVASAPWEDSSVKGIFSNAAVDNNVGQRGALFVYEFRQNAWKLINYLKAESDNPLGLELGVNFYRETFNGTAWINDGTPLSIDASGKIIAAGAPAEDSPGYSNNGAVFIFDASN